MYKDQLISKTVKEIADDEASSIEKKLLIDDNSGKFILGRLQKYGKR
jgi:hypothetical protein